MDLPDSRYKTIQIDDNSLVNIGTDTQIALLRIIQKTVTNIIRHAKAKKTILGLESIRRRVQYLDGETDIRSSAKGTEIMVSIPLVAV